MTGGVIPVPTAGGSVVLENGVQITFNTAPGDGNFRSGDYWVFAARTADASVEELDKAPPRGVHHHYCRLALISLGQEGSEILADCRELYPPSVTIGDEPGIHVRDVRLADGQPLRNDTDVWVAALLRGIGIECDEPVDPAGLKRPTCFVTLEMPFPLNHIDRELWGDAVIGFQPLVLAADVKASENLIAWRPSQPTISWLQERLFKMLNELRRGDRLLARLTLKGNFIWGKSAELFLDGEVFGAPGDGKTELMLPSGNGRRGGDFEMWFWLVEKTPIDRDRGTGVSSITINPGAVTAGARPQGTVTLSGPAPVNGVTVTLASSNPEVATVPQSLTIANGATAGNFRVTTRRFTSPAQVQAVITASDEQTSQQTTLLVRAL